MNYAQILQEQFRTTHWVIRNQAKGLSHADSVIQPPVRGNCFNWVLGHILGSRNRVLGYLDCEPVFDPQLAKRYARGSEPIRDADDAPAFEDLLDVLSKSQDAILEALEACTSDQLSAIDEKGRSNAQKLSFNFFHEAYHAGQLELLRQLAGKDDSVID